MSDIERLIAAARARLLGRRILITHNPSKPQVGPAWFHSDNVMQDIIFNGNKVGEVRRGDPQFSLKVSEMIGKSIRESRRAASPFLKGTTEKGFATGGFVHAPVKGKDEIAAWLTGEWSEPMSYNYGGQRAYIFTDEGQRTFLKIRDNAKSLIAKTGAATMGKLTAGFVGSDWDHMACIDRMVELNELREIKNSLSGAGQHRIFIAPL